MARRPGLRWAIPFALAVQGASFQLTGSPIVSKISFGRASWRGTTTRRPFRCNHVRDHDAASGTSAGTGSEAGYGQAREAESAESGSSPLVEYFVRHGIESAEIVPTVSDYTQNFSTPTTAAATAVVFVKTVIFQAKGEPFAAVMREGLVADRGIMARHFRLPNRQVTLAGAPFVGELTGFPVGTIPPLGHRKRLPTLVDAELLKYSTIVGGAGCRGFDSRLSLTDLLKATCASVIPLARPRKAQNGAGQEGLSTNGVGAMVPTLSWDSSSTAAAAPPATAPAAPPVSVAAPAVVPAAVAAVAAAPAPATTATTASSAAASAACVTATAIASAYDTSASAVSEVGCSAGDDSAAAAVICGFDLSGSGDAPSAGDHLDDDGQAMEASITSPTTGTDTNTGGGGDSTGNPGAGAVRVTVASTGEVEAGVEAKAEARLRVVSAAMRTVSAALSALSALGDDGDGVGSGTGSLSISVSDGGGDGAGDRDRGADGGREMSEQGAVVSSEALSSFVDAVPGADAGGRFGRSGSGASAGGREKGVKQAGVDAAAAAVAGADAAANTAAGATAGSPISIEHQKNLGVTVVKASARSTEGSGVDAVASTDRMAPARVSNASQSQSESQRPNQVATPAQAQAGPVDSSSGERYRSPWRSTAPESGETKRAQRDGDDSEMPPGGKVGEGAAAAAAATAASGRTRTVGAVADGQSDEAGGRASATKGAASYDRKLTRTAGTPTVDAIGGDVHLVAVVAGKRSLTRLLHFVDLVPPTETAPVADQTCFVRKAWMGPGTAGGHLSRPVQVQLVMGKTLVDRMGEMEARVAMRAVKRGQLLYVTGKPTPDTRARFSDAATAATAVATANAYSATAATTNSDGGGVAAPSNADTYDLVCCSLRMLEDAPLVAPELVGKGDEWTGGGDYLKMDLDEEAVTYVDSSRRLREMGSFLRKTLLDPSAMSGARRKPQAAVLPALAVDCEWRPGRVAGRPENPVCLMQLAAGDRTYIVDMLHVCRPKGAVVNGDPTMDSPSVATGKADRSSPRLTKMEALLEEALGGVLNSPGVVKVGLGPKADFQSLVRSYPHIPSFRRVCSVVNLCHVASNASSLRGKPSEEKSSLSRLCNLVLGKPLDKSEQCSDWGNRPLSGRQKRYAALDARATLLIHRELAPQVPAERMESLYSTFAYDHRSHGLVTTQTLPSYIPRNSGGAPERNVDKKRAARRRVKAGGSRHERMVRKQMLGVTMIDVSKVLLDEEGLGKNWLGRALPGVTKEGVVRACIYPMGEMPTSGELPTVLRFDRHQSFVEFGNGYALLMNCGGTAKEREHASGFLDESGSTAVWYLQGKLSSDANMVDLEAAEWQQQQQQQTLRSETEPGTEPGTDNSGGGGGALGNKKAVTTAAAAAAADGSDSVGKFLQRLADASGAPSSILGGLPEDDPPSVSDSTGAAATQSANPQLAAAGEKRRGAWGGGREGAKPAQAPHLVLFARAKGRPFVYCGAVECVAEEYVWSAGSSRLGAVRFTLALREWRKAATNSGVKGEAGGGVTNGGRNDNGVDNVFTEVVREGLRPPALVLGLPSEDRVVG